MKKFLFFSVVLFISVTAFSQTYNNEWIDYSKTHYKFFVGTNGLYKINQPVLAAAGLGATQAQDYRLWRNGVEIPIYTSQATGVLGASDFIEFYGEQNDGKPDKPLYQADANQMNDALSMFTDTAAYFLTVNSTSSNKRLVNTANNVASNVLPAEQWFSYTRKQNFRTQQNPGYAIDYGRLVHSSSFEQAEGWTSGDIVPGTFTDNPGAMYLYSSGPNASITGTVAGNAGNGRTISIGINGTPIASSFIGGYTHFNFSNSSIALTTFSGDVANIEITNGGSSGDRIVASNYKLTYPRIYNFGGQSKFEFDLPASGSKYLAIKNFSFGASTPVLYDITNGLRLSAVINVDTVKFVLPASAVARKLVLLNTESGNVKNITALNTTTFVNYANAANQGDYIIISHPNLYNNGSGVNNVDLYRQYRNSVAGGGFNTKVVDINQITDQFAFGIKNHPASIKNFASYSLANFTTIPKYFFLIGKGLDYVSYTNYKSDINTPKIAMIPTFGWPPSDNLLTSSRTANTPRIPIGRLSAITGTEVGDYLNKVQQMDSARTLAPQTFAGKGWMKNIAQLTGALVGEEALYGSITAFYQTYQGYMEDTLYGAKTYNFDINTGSSNAIGTTKSIDNMFNEGLSMLTYFGHSSPNKIEFNLDNPQNYNNTGKYPLIIVNGCEAGDLFLFDTLRAISKGTISDKFVFAPNKGSIGFISSTHFGLAQELHYFTTDFNRYLAGPMYGKGVGDIMKSTMVNMMANYSYDYAARTHAEQITYHGDPAIKLNTHLKPDYTTLDSLITLNPTKPTVADTKLTFITKIQNIGKAIKDSLTIRFRLQLPDSSVISIGDRRIKATLSEDTVMTSITINPLFNKGVNKFIVIIDPINLIDELSETNNTITKSFTITDDDIRPVYPYKYAIVNISSNFALWGSTINPSQVSKSYVMELDTTQLFNSPFKKTVTVASAVGSVKFVPSTFTMVDSTVYFWRLAPLPITAATSWNSSSFTFINGSTEGFNQSNYYQYKENEFDGMIADSTSKTIQFANQIKKLLIRTGLYPYYGWDQININLDGQQLDQYGCRYEVLQAVVYDPLTMLPLQNYNVSATSARFGSSLICDNPTRNFFELRYDDSAWRRRSMNFFDSIPNGYFISLTNLSWTGNTHLISEWKADSIGFGNGKSLWHKLHTMGLHKIDSFTTNRPFMFLFKKGDTLSFTPQQIFGTAANEHLVESFNMPSKITSGSEQTPWVGPAKQWFNFKWKDKAFVGSTNSKYFEIFGKNNLGVEASLAKVYAAQDTSIAFINATQYPYLRMKMYADDPSQSKPEQLKYWMLNGTQSPEGAIAPNLLFQYQDSLTNNDTLKFKVAFLNISKTNFDSVKVRLRITDKNGVNHDYGTSAKRKPLVVNDSLQLIFDIPAAGYEGYNQVYLDVNPDNNQPEQFHFNNIVFRSLQVANSICPGSGVTFTTNNNTVGNIYQWQVNTGSGYTNVSNAGVYSGVNTSSLSLASPPTNFTGYKYRCLITNGTLTTYSTENVLRFGVIWNGSISTAWETIGNWNCAAIPDQYTDVIIRGGLPRYPNVNSSGICRSISVQPGSTVTVMATFKLDVKGQ